MKYMNYYFSLFVIHTTRLCVRYIMQIHSRYHVNVKHVRDEKQMED